MPELTVSLPQPVKPEQLAQLAAVPGLTEVLLEHQSLSRMGRMTGPQLLDLSRAAAALGLRRVLVWDLPVVDAELNAGLGLVEDLGLEHFDAVRVQDPGVARLVRDRFPNLPRHLILETGNHNLTGIRTWIQHIQPARVMLSNELPLSLQQEIRAAVATPVEIPVLGRIPIFYTPRKLISAAEQDPNDPESSRISAARFEERFITSEEDRKHFPLVENDHGTTMFYEKDLFLLPYLAEIEAAGIDVIRLDLRFYNTPSLPDALRSVFSGGGQTALDAVKACMAPKVTRGFFKSNRTDKQFVKLKNRHLQTKEDQSGVGSVLETGKRKYLVLQTSQTLNVGETLTFVIPEGNHIQAQIKWLRNSAGAEVQTAPPGLWLMNHVPKISSGSMVYRD